MQIIIWFKVLAYIWPHIGPASVVVKKQLMYYAIFGVASWTWGSLFIDRSNTERAITSLQKQSEAITKKKVSNKMAFDNNQHRQFNIIPTHIYLFQIKLIFFPEGTRNEGEHLLMFKKGPFKLALQCRCSVQPIVVSRNYFFRNRSGGEGRISGRGIIRIMPEITTTNIQSDCLVTFIERVHGEMDEVYQELNRQISL